MTMIVILAIVATLKMVIFGEVLACVLNTINSIAGGHGAWYVAYNSQYAGWLSVIILTAMVMYFIIERKGPSKGSFFLYKLLLSNSKM